VFYGQCFMAQIQSQVEAICTMAVDGSHSLVRQTGSDTAKTPSRTALWGLYAVYACVGIVNGFFASNIGGVLICQNRFGHMGYPGGVQSTQCQAAPSMYQVGWNLKIFIALMVDNFKIFGTRKRYWVIGSWALALVVLVVATLMLPSILDKVDEGHAGDAYSTYVFVLMGVCLCYAFADVAADAMTVEYSKVEPEEHRGTVIATGYQVRFFFVLLMGAFKTLTMSGEQFVAEGDAPPFKFGLDLTVIHWCIIAMVCPCFLCIVMWIEDPPVLEERKGGFAGVVDAASSVWKCSKSYAVYSLMLYAFGTGALAQVTNPADTLVAQIANPDGITLGLGTMLNYAVMIAGLWLFKKYFLDKNMRTLSMWCYASCAVLQLLELIVTYAGHFPGAGWFYILQQDLPQITQAIAFALMQIAIVEIAPHGLEASVYELLVSFNNIAKGLASVIQNQMTESFHLKGIGAENFTHAQEMDHSQLHEYQSSMMGGILTAVAIACLASWFSGFFLPRNAAECQEWRARTSWQTTSVGALNITILGVALFQMFFGLVVSVGNITAPTWINPVVFAILGAYQLFGLGERLFACFSKPVES